MLFKKLRRDIAENYAALNLKNYAALTLIFLL